MKNKRSTIVFAVSLLALIAVLIVRKVQNNNLWPDVPASEASAPVAPNADITPTPELPSVDEQDYVISLVGDCTLASAQFIDPSEHRSIE